MSSKHRVAFYHIFIARVVIVCELICQIDMMPS